VIESWPPIWCTTRSSGCSAGSYAFEAYLRQTVVNLCRMHFRRKRVERTYLRREEQGLPQQAAGPDVDFREDLWQALLRLPERQRVAIVLHYYEDHRSSRRLRF
jgi:RNA polymerase sigma factor (sigma-70 family)